MRGHGAQRHDNPKENTTQQSAPEPSAMPHDRTSRPRTAHPETSLRASEAQEILSIGLRETSVDTLRPSRPSGTGTSGAAAAALARR
jgi:hypothetical protein